MQITKFYHICTVSYANSLYLNCNERVSEYHNICNTLMKNGSAFRNIGENNVSFLHCLISLSFYHLITENKKILLMRPFIRIRCFFLCYVSSLPTYLDIIIIYVIHGLITSCVMDSFESRSSACRYRKS